jgi:hypothetical protein
MENRVEYVTTATVYGRRAEHVDFLAASEALDKELLMTCDYTVNKNTSTRNDVCR